jgi:hypothetical protein
VCEAGQYLDAHGLEVHLVLHVTHTARRSEKSLGGHTAAVDARAADVMALDDRDLHPVLDGVQRGAVAPYATANDDEVVVILGRCCGCAVRLGLCSEA